MKIVDTKLVCIYRLLGDYILTVCSSLCVWCCRILLFEEKSKQEKNKATGPAPKRTMEELLAKWEVGVKTSVYNTYTAHV